MHWSHYSLIQFWASCISKDILPIFLHTRSIPWCTVQVGGAIRIKCTGQNIFFYGRNQRGCVEGNIFETAILFMAVSKGNRFDQLTVPVQPPSTPLPHPAWALTAKRGQGWKKLRGNIIICGYCVWWQDLVLSQINCIFKAVKEGETSSDQRTPSEKKARRTDDLVAAIVATIEGIGRLMVWDLVTTHVPSIGTVLALILGYLGLVKNSALWMPMLLSTAQKREWEYCSNDFLDLLQ
jgi:hypothetical protein